MGPDMVNSSIFYTNCQISFSNECVSAYELIIFVIRLLPLRIDTHHIF